MLPLPKQIGSDHLLRVTDTGDQGLLLDPAFYERLPRLTGENTSSEIRDSLRALAVRIDPCFPADPPQVCLKQLRIVWQILRPNARGETETVDAALHSFYTLNDVQFNSLLTDLTIWKENLSSEGLPLQIHPAWAKDLDNSPALFAFQNIVKKYAGTKTLTRVTVMSVRNLGQTWGFVGADILNGKTNVMKIPRINANSQIFINQALRSNYFLGQITPMPGSINPPKTDLISDTINNIITDSNTLRTEHEDTLRDELKSIYHIENPKIFNPNTMDCVSCHAANSARTWTFQHRQDLDLNEIFKKYGYENLGFNLTNISAPSEANTFIIRAFGYFLNKPALSQRVINESAEVAQTLNQLKN